MTNVARAREATLARGAISVDAVKDKPIAPPCGKRIYWIV
jgi:hypothetical protein